MYGWGTTESLPYDEINNYRNVKLEDILNTPNDSDNRCFLAVDSKCPDEKKENTK